MTQFLNFEVMEVNGATKEEALAKAPFSIMGDATQAFKNWKAKQVGGVTEADKKQFMLDYLTKKSKNCAGVGFAITLESAVKDTRMRPYTMVKHKNEDGARKFATVLVAYDKATGTPLIETPVKHVQAKDKDGNLLKNEDGTPKMVWKPGTKSTAEGLVKALYTDKDYKGNIICKYEKKVVEGDPVAFEVNYTPSTNCKVGSYLVFGIR